MRVITRNMIRCTLGSTIHGFWLYIV